MSEIQDVLDYWAREAELARSGAGLPPMLPDFEPEDPLQLVQEPEGHPNDPIPPYVRELLATKVRVVDPATGGQKEQSLVRPDLIPAIPKMLVGAVYGYGAQKYAPNNWRKGYAWSLSVAAMERHLALWQSGEDIDPESGLPHLAHAAFHLNALLEYGFTHPEGDDRWSGAEDHRPPVPTPPSASSASS